MDALLDGSAVTVARAVAAGEASPVELVDAALARIEERNPPLNAVVALRAETAREEARDLERALAAGEEPGPLAGVPITVKESVAVKGMPWTGASRVFGGDVAASDAPAVVGLRGAGAIPVGVTNTSELCTYYDSYNPLYGATHNPHDLALSAGGSSGGEAAALAAGMVPLGVGTDLGGSIRFPASLTGVFGLKAGGGTVPVRGHHPGPHPPPSYELMCQIGPMARHAEDLEPALEAMAGRPVGPAAHGAAPHAVAVFEEDGLNPVAAPCRAAVRRVADALAEMGIDVHEAAPPRQREAREVFDTLLLADLACLLGPRLADHRELLGERLGGMVDALAGVDIPLRAYLEAGMKLHELDDAVAEWQERFALAVCPAGPVNAFPVETRVTEVEGAPTNPVGILTLCTYPTVLRLPACTVPAGRDGDGLPVAVQVFGRHGQEADVLALARRLEEPLGGAVLPPVARRP